jgi:hypothetical protein
VAKSAAMQIYLNNRSSRGGAANENYARELFELHTLGRPAYLNALYNRWRDVPGALDRRPQGYIDQDVYQAARAFTGWSIEDGAGIGAGRRLPMTGKFIYVENWHDNYQKRVLATEFDPTSHPWPMASVCSIWWPIIPRPRGMSAKSSVVAWCRTRPMPRRCRRGQGLDRATAQARPDRPHGRGDRAFGRLPPLGRDQGEAAARTFCIVCPFRRDCGGRPRPACWASSMAAASGCLVGPPTGTLTKTTIG